MLLTKLFAVTILLAAFSSVTVVVVNSPFDSSLTGPAAESTEGVFVFTPRAQRPLREHIHGGYSTEVIHSSSDPDSDSGRDENGEWEAEGCEVQE